MTAQAEWLGHWEVIWRSELRALAEDPELGQAMRHGVDAAGRAWAAPPPWAAAVAAAPAAGGAAEHRRGLEQRVAELERRLAELDPAGPA